MLSEDYADDFGGKTEGWLVGGFDKILQGFLDVFVAFLISEILFFYSKGILYPACLKCSSNVSACFIPNSAIVIKEKQSIIPHDLSERFL